MELHCIEETVCASYASERWTWVQSIDRDLFCEGLDRALLSSADLY